MIALIVLGSAAVLAAAYLVYGRFLASRLQLDDSKPTPAVTVNDGQDYVPASAGLLLGQHFSAISAAGPIVGPVLAGIWFGWLPALMWIILGSIFIGGVHDFSSLIASVRHGGASIGEIVRRNLSPTAYRLFLAFVWLCLVYVIAAFTDITAQTFRAMGGSGEPFGAGVAASSLFYILAAMAMGILLYRWRWKVGKATLVFLPLVMLIIWLGPHLPASWLHLIASVPVKGWDVVLLGYCFFAAIIPVWLLLQPRGYLGGWLLYLVIAAGLGGALFGRIPLAYPALNLHGLASVLNGKPLLPLLFITIACGACSGFHGIVASGTTSKQLARERDARPVGYGAMLLEALVAVLALATVMALAPGSPALKEDPNLIYARGIARYLGLAGIDPALALSFALLAFSTFVYDTLDVCTRLARYILQEFTGLKGRAGGWLATAATLVLPLLFLLSTKEKGYLVAWPIFGSSNQLLAALTLLALAVWLKHSGRRIGFVIIPLAVMLVMSMWSLVLLVKPFLSGSTGFDNLLSAVLGLILLVLSLFLLAETARVLNRRRAEPVARDQKR
ncbi:MAG: carbon starvation protein A [Candidatus Aminicenantes bacterium]|nr:carbon starvation protein A [Candidatus Aminicenantes bacterium]